MPSGCDIPGKVFPPLIDPVYISYVRAEHRYSIISAKLTSVRAYWDKSSP